MTDRASSLLAVTTAEVLSTLDEWRGEDSMLVVDATRLFEGGRRYSPCQADR